MIIKIGRVRISENETVGFTYQTMAEKISILERFGIVYDPSTDETDNEINIESLRAGYIAFVQRMQKIQTEPSPTNAQVILARYLEITGKILRFLFEE